MTTFRDSLRLCSRVRRASVVCVAFAVSACAGTAPPRSADTGASATEALAILRAESLASGGDAWAGIAGLRMEGTITEGGVPAAYEKVVEFRNGYSRAVQGTSVARQYTGYDGLPWNASNGIVNSVDLPTLVQDAKSRAFIDAAHWRRQALVRNRITQVRNLAGGVGASIGFRPEGGSELVLTFDPRTHLVARIELDTDDGRVTMTLSDWRDVGRVKYPFRQEQTDNTGSEVVIQLQRVQLLSNVDADLLARPPVVPHGRIAQGTSSTVPITFVGAGQNHILIEATIAGVETNLIFDTGAANYFSPDAARRFGLRVFGGVNLTGVGESSTTGGFATVDRMSIGTAELSDETVIIGPLPFPNTGSGPRIDGSAGFEYLYEFRTTIDYPAHSVTFRPRSDTATLAGTKVPFFSDGHSIYVEAEVEGRLGIFRLDTGYGGTVTLFPAFAARNGLNRGTAPAEAVGGGVGGQVSARPIVMSRFVLAGVAFDNLPGYLSLNRAGSFTSRALAGNLGGGVLKCFRITFDYSARELTFERHGVTPGCPSR